MTKSEAIKDLIITLAISLAIGLALVLMTKSYDMYTWLLGSMFFGGIPSGWKWMGKRIPLSLYSFVVILLLSMVLGWLAVLFRIVKDIFYIIKGSIGEKSSPDAAVMDESSTEDPTAE